MPTSLIGVMASYLLKNGYREYTYVLTCPGVSVMGGEAFSRGWRESGERRNASLSLFVYKVNDLTHHEKIRTESLTVNRTKITLDISAYKSDNKIKFGII